MTEAARQARNAMRLLECHPAFRLQVAWLLDRLGVLGYRPRIQEAWRSLADQAAAVERGTSKRRWGYHNASSMTGECQALAVDVLDDDHALEPGAAYLAALSREAWRVGLATGVGWGLPAGVWRGLRQAILTGADITPWAAAGKIGWDPCHVQSTGLTLADVQRGRRPALEDAQRAVDAATRAVAKALH